MRLLGYSVQRDILYILHIKPQLNQSCIPERWDHGAYGQASFCWELASSGATPAFPYTHRVQGPSLWAFLSSDPEQNSLMQKAWMLWTDQTMRTTSWKIITKRQPTLLSDLGFGFEDAFRKWGLPGGLQPFPPRPWYRTKSTATPNPPRTHPKPTLSDPLAPRWGQTLK